MYRHELTDEQWSAVQDLLPKRTAKTGRTPSDGRLMLNGIFWVLCTGAPWRDLGADRLGPVVSGRGERAGRPRRGRRL